jgi:hypothetical protein
LLPVCCLDRCPDGRTRWWCCRPAACRPFAPARTAHARRDCRGCASHGSSARPRFRARHWRACDIARLLRLPVTLCISLAEKPNRLIAPLVL